MQRVAMGTMTSVKTRDFYPSFSEKKRHFAVSGLLSLSSREWFECIERVGSFELRFPLTPALKVFCEKYI